MLLDEIADVPSVLQVKLLRTIEQREILPVGGAESRSLDVRILAATNRPLAGLIAEGTFREDLFFRLGVFQIYLPPLRERPQDVLPLAEHFLMQVRPSHDGMSWQFSDDACEELCSRVWAGNIRELRNVVEHAAIVARGAEIRREHFPPPAALGGAAQVPLVKRIQQEISGWTANVACDIASGDDPQLYERFLQMSEPPLLESVLKYCHGNRAAAAQLLGLHRATLRQKMRRHGLEDFLKNVRRILLLEAATATPVEDQRSIQVHYPIPGSRVVGAEAIQKAS